MKKLLIFVFLTLSFKAYAGGMSDISWMALEEAHLFLSNKGYHLEEPPSALAQRFVVADHPTGIAVETIVFVTQPVTEQWTCVSQFAKTAQFFKIFKTSCHK